jgi:predicted nucleic acid-binding protein
MVLVDTSVWIAHLKQGQPPLANLLASGLVLLHPFVAGELACGNLRNRAAILADLATLPVAACASDQEVMRLVDHHQLWGRGLGWIDAHLLASALLSHARLWTLDKRLAAAAAAASLQWS